MAARKRASRRQRTAHRRARGRSSAARRTAKRAKSPRRRPASRKAAARKPRKRAVSRPAARRPRKAASTAPRKTTPRAPRQTTPRAPTETAAQRSRRPVSPVLLDRERRRLPESERVDTPQAPPEERQIAAARTGHDELQRSLLEHTETSPRLTAGDVDAKWTDAYAVGDEAPGGDNPTPDQDRVDDIGRALGVQYQDDEELNPDEKIRERDRHRWELDPASSEDWPHKEDKEDKK
jgi:uncharacterized protein DUF6335